MDKNEALKKIKLQMKKTNKGKISPERRQQMVQGILDANIDSEYLIKSEMPEEIMGIKVDWDKRTAGAVVIEKGIKPNPTVETEVKEAEKVVEEEEYSEEEYSDDEKYSNGEEE